MKESVNKQAIMEDVDTETFDLFLQYAYTGMYRIESGSQKRLVSHRSEDNVPYEERVANQAPLRYCALCRNYPYRANCRPDRCGKFKVDIDLCHTCGRPLASFSSEPACEGEGEDIPDGVFSKFSAKKYATIGRDHGQTRQYLESLVPSDPTTSKITAHVKLYCFAQQWMV